MEEEEGNGELQESKKSYGTMKREGKFQTTSIYHFKSACTDINEMKLFLIDPN